MYASVEAVYGDILIKFEKLLVEEGRNEISASVPQNFIYAFSDTVGEGHGLNRIKSVIILITVEVPAAPETGNGILLESDGKKLCSMLYLILTLMLGVGNEEPWMLLWLQETHQGLWT